MLERPASRAPAQEVNVDDREKKKLILVVDDDHRIKELTRDLLELFGHTVMTASSRREALALCELRGKDISVVLLDGEASEPDSSDVFQKILEINPATKVIVTSKHGHRHDRGSGDDFNRGPVCFLKKPYRMSELLQIVEQDQEMQ